MTRSTESASSRDAYPPVPRPIASSPYVPQMSVGVLAAVVALSVLFFLTSLNRLNHTDLWGHLAYGRWISQSGKLPAKDPFGALAGSSGLAGRFVNLPWLAQWSAYELHRLGGAESLALSHAVLATVGCGLLMLAIATRELRPVVAVAGGVLMYLLALPSMGTLRPQLWGIVAFPLVLLAIGVFPQRRHPLFWLPVVFLLWANLHGSFILGLGVLAIWALAGWWDERRAEARFDSEDKNLARTDTQSRPLFWLLAVCVVACCLNPAGPRLLVEVASFGGNPALEQIVEWGPLVIQSLGGSLFFGSLLVTIFVVRLSSWPFRLAEVMLLVVFGFLALMSMRMLVWWAILWPWVFLPHLLSCWPRREQQSADTEYPAASRGTMRTLYALGCVLIALCWSPPSQALITGQTRHIGELTSSDTPVYVADQIRWRNMAGNAFCPLDWGDYLIWRTEGAIKPLVYSHVHLVHPEIWDDYLRINRGDRSWLRLADQYKLDYLILSRKRNRTLVRDVQRLPRASIEYQDEQCLLVRLLPPPDDQASTTGNNP